MMKIVSYNVNGLRQRIAQHGSLCKLLNSLDADVICFQETKLTREELTADLIMAEGYESFFSCTCTSGRGHLGYSGVATFCRVTSAFSSIEVALPVSAEEGFTGLLEHCRCRNFMKKDILLELSAKMDDLEGLTNEDLLKIDSEGRCLITDHGHFVIFNIYGPRAEPDDIERINFKLTFFKILQKRWESYFKEGKRVFVVGDLNIAPFAIDRCDAGPDFEQNQFRKWFRSLLVEQGGPFFDAFRVKHPQRKDAYTCWSMASGAEEFNYGSRIDHILVAGPCMHQNNMDGHNFVACHVIDCDIMNQFKRWKPDYVPRWKGGKNIKLEGSDHVPVYVSLREIPDLMEHNTPSLAARYDPKVHGSQQTIVSFLSRRQVNSHVNVQSVSQISDNNFSKGVCFDNVVRLSQDGCASKSTSLQELSAVNQESEHIASSSGSNGVSKENNLVRLRSETEKTVPVGSKKSNKKARNGSSIQLTLGSYFPKKQNLNVDTDLTTASLSPSRGDISKIASASSLCSEKMSSCKGVLVGDIVKISLQKNEVESVPSECSPEKEKHDVALLEWQRIQKLMLKSKSVPLCKGHHEPCVARVVKKEGPSFGRKFYVCQRAEGPSSNPDARCDYFKWATESVGLRR